MAAVIGDYIPEPSRFHAMIANPPLQHHHHHPHAHHPHDASPYRGPSRPRNSSSSSTPRSSRSASAAAAAQAAPTSGTDSKQPAQSLSKEPCASSDPTASRIPSPPQSSSPAVAHISDDDANTEPMASEMTTTTVNPSHAPAASNPTQQPSPSSDFSIPAPLTPQEAPRQTVIHVRDLDHVKDLAKSELLSNPSASDAPSQQIKYDISAMSTNDVIEMVAALLTKITSTNDLQHDAMQRNVTHQQQANQSSDSPGGSINPMTHSVLAFHGKNVPAITILSYLSRIHKYCPTTFEVFLSLLVFFDRMTERVNDLVTKSEEARKAARSAQSQRSGSTDTAMRDNTAEPDESDSDLADDDDEDDDMGDSPRRVITVPSDELTSANGPSTYFVVDSFNIHRLIIAGVTAASKFFSDVFYTNSRYAKVSARQI